MKSCPFCLGTDLEMCRTLGANGTWAHYVNCRFCAAQGPYAREKTEGIGEWNRQTEIRRAEREAIELWDKRA